MGTLLLFYLLAWVLPIAWSVATASGGTGVPAVEGFAARDPAVEFRLGATPDDTFVELHLQLGQRNPEGRRLVLASRALTPAPSEDLGLAELVREGFGVRSSSPGRGLVALLEGLETCSTGDADFDRDFVVATNRREGPATLLGRELRPLVAELLTTGGTGAVTLRLVRYALDVRKLGCRPGSGDATAFLMAASRVVEALLDGVALRAGDGAPVARLLEAQPEPTQLCGICGEALDATAVLCAACETPHHRDCWEYLGHCSTYACSSTRRAA